MPLVKVSKDIEVLVDGFRYSFEKGEHEVSEELVDAIEEADKEVKKEESKQEPTPAAADEQQVNPLPPVAAPQTPEAQLPVDKQEPKASRAPKGVRNVKSALK